MFDGILVVYSEGLMFECLDDTALVTIDTVGLGEDDGIVLGKILGVELSFKLGMLWGFMRPLLGGGVSCYLCLVALLFM